jgi:hypothetical protein
MNVSEQIKSYIASQPEPKRGDMQALHDAMVRIMPGRRLWFLDGTDENGKVVTNPNIGYGFQVMKYADGKTREFYQIGVSAGKGGISVYLLGIEDRKHLARAYGGRIGKADVTGYCIRFKALKDIDVDVLEEAVRFTSGTPNEGVSAQG